MTTQSSRPVARAISICLPSLLAALIISAPAQAEAPRALPAGQLPNDVRLSPLKDLDGYFPFTPPKSSGEWPQRAERARWQMADRSRGSSRNRFDKLENRRHA